MHKYWHRARLTALGLARARASQVLLRCRCRIVGVGDGDAGAAPVHAWHVHRTGCNSGCPCSFPICNRRRRSMSGRSPSCRPRRRHMTSCCAGRAGRVVRLTIGMLQKPPAAVLAGSHVDCVQHTLSRQSVPPGIARSTHRRSRRLSGGASGTAASVVTVHVAASRA